MKKLLLALFLALPFISNAQTDSIGVFYEIDASLNKIEPIMYSKTKTSTLGTALTMGIASSSVKQVFKGATSNNKVSNTPVFYFYFNQDIPFGLINKYYMFYASDNPSDILLAKFKGKKKERELTIGKVNVYSGSEMGTADDLDIRVEYEEIKKGVFKVWFDKPLEEGEYCFVHNGPNGAGAFMHVFDFSVK